MGRATQQDASEQYGYSVLTVGPFAVSEPIEDFGGYSPFSYAAFGVETGSTPPPTLSGNAYYVLTLAERTEFDSEAFQDQASGINSRLLQQKVDDYVAYWYDQLRAEGDIEDYRSTL